MCTHCTHVEVLRPNCRLSIGNLPMKWGTTIGYFFLFFPSTMTFLKTFFSIWLRGAAVCNATCLPHIESWTQPGVGVAVVFPEGLGENIKDSLWDEHCSHRVPPMCSSFQRQPSFGGGHSCACGHAVRPAAAVFSTLCVLFVWKADVGVWVLKGRCIPWAHAGQEATLSTNSMLASLLSLHVSVWGTLVCIYWVTTFSALLQIGRPRRGLGPPSPACRLQQGMYVGGDPAPPFCTHVSPLVLT